VGLRLGATVGNCGLRVGGTEGFIVGTGGTGLRLGLAGLRVGAGVGLRVGACGLRVGIEVGLPVGPASSVPFGLSEGGRLGEAGDGVGPSADIPGLPVGPSADIMGGPVGVVEGR